MELTTLPPHRDTRLNITTPRYPKIMQLNIESGRLITLAFGRKNQIGKNTSIVKKNPISNPTKPEASECGENRIIERKTCLCNFSTHFSR